MTITNEIDPDCRTSASVVVTVRRNLLTPQFVNPPYEFTIAETETPYGNPFGGVQAQDFDRLVLILFIVVLH